VFVERESLLSEGGDGFRTLENIFLAFLLLLGIYICTEEYFERGTPIPDLDMFKWVFSKMDKVILTLFGFFCINLTILPLVQAIKKANLSPYIHIPLYFMIQICLYTVGIYSFIDN
jgi:hypothetical protein